MKIKNGSTSIIKNSSFVLGHQAVDVSKFNQRDWHEILHFMLWTCMMEESSIHTTFPNEKVLDEEVSWGCGLFRPDCKDEKFKVIIKKPVKDIDFKLEPNTRLIPMCPVDYFSGNYNNHSGWRTNNILHDYFILKAPEITFGWVILTRTLVRRASSGYKVCPTWAMNIFTQKYSFRCVTQDTICEFCKKNPQLGLRMISAYIKNLDVVINEKKSVIDNMVRKRNLVEDTFKRMGGRL